MSLELQSRAEALGQSLPPLLAQAEFLAATVMLGEHGRRRSGQGDEFWQYRAAMPGDSLRLIDWRRSGMSDHHFVREREWQAAQSVSLWVDAAKSMSFSGDKSRETKSDRARLLALALAVLLLRGGERVGLCGADVPPRPGRAQLVKLSAALSADASPQDYGAPEVHGMVPHGRAVFFSDFLGDPTAVDQALIQAADRGVRGALVMVLDPAEEDFPFAGRTIFESMTGGLRHETQQASDLRQKYLTRLAQRKDHLTQIAAKTGWQMTVHHTGHPAQTALLWLFQAMQGGR